MRNMKKKIGLCILAMLVAFPIMSNLGGKQAIALATAGEYPITYGSKISNSSPKLDGNRLVWTGGNDVYVRHVTMKETTRLSSSGKAYSPDIQGNFVVWAENRDSSNDIFLYDLVGGNETRITNTPSAYEVKPLLAGTEQPYIVYGAGKGIFLYDTLAGTAAKINSLEDSATSVQMGYTASGNYVAWYESRYNSTIQKTELTFTLYTISDGQSRTIAVDANKSDTQPNLSIYGDKLLWQDKRDGSNYSNIYMYDLITNSGTFLAPSDNNQTFPVMDGNTVVWLDNRSGKAQVYAYDLIKAEGAPVTITDVAKSSIDYSGNAVVWVRGMNIYASADIGPSAIEALNEAADAETLRNLIEVDEIGLTLGEYAGWQKVKDKQVVAGAIWSARPAQGFASLADVQAAFNDAVLSRSPIATVNTASTMAALTTALGMPGLGLDLTAYRALEQKEQAAAIQTFYIERASAGFDSLEGIQRVLDEAVLAWSASKFRYIDDMDMNGWFGDMAADGNGKLYVVYQDNDQSEKATVRRYDQASSNWVNVGAAGFTANSVGSAFALAFDSANRPYVAFSDEGQGKKITVMKFNGSQWETVGAAGFSAGSNPFFLSLIVGSGNVPYVAYSESGASGRGHVTKFNGTSWVQAGSTTPMSGGARYITLKADSAGTPHLAFSARVDTKSETRVMKLNGDTWSNVGSPPKDQNPYYLQFAIGNDDTLYYDLINTNDGSKYVVMKYDAVQGQWVEVAHEQTFSLTAAHRLMAGGDAIYLTYADKNEGNRATIMKLNNGVWSPVETPGFTDAGTDSEYSKVVLADGTLFYGFLVRGSQRGNLTAVMANSNPGAAQTYTLAAMEDIELPELISGYASGQQPSSTIAIKKTGIAVLKNVTVELDGANAGDFEFTQPDVSSLKKFKPIAAFTIKAKDGLAAGTYSATVTVKAELAESVSFTVTQTVNPTSGEYTVAYNAGAHGSIQGEATEQVQPGGQPTAVPTVTANAGYAFVGWSSDGGATKLSPAEVAAAIVSGNIAYTARYVLKGDANGDGAVTNADALLLTKFIKGLATLTAEQKLALDMNGDNKWDAEDVQLILKLCVGKGETSNG